MHGETRWALTAFVSVVLWYPALSRTLAGDLEFTDGALRYVLALAVAWVAVGFLDRLVSGYEISGVVEGHEKAVAAARLRRQEDVDATLAAAMGDDDLDTGAPESPPEEALAG